MSALEDTLVGQIRALNLPAPEREVVLIPGRKFRVDLYWPTAKLVVEVDGGTWVQGRHSRGAGYETDCEKLNLLTLMGLRVLRVTGQQVRNTQAVEWIERALDGEKR